MGINDLLSKHIFQKPEVGMIAFSDGIMSVTNYTCIGVVTKVTAQKITCADFYKSGRDCPIFIKTDINDRTELFNYRISRELMTPENLARFNENLANGECDIKIKSQVNSFYVKDLLLSDYLRHYYRARWEHVSSIIRNYEGLCKDQLMTEQFSALEDQFKSDIVRKATKDLCDYLLELEKCI